MYVGFIAVMYNATSGFSLEVNKGHRDARAVARSRAANRTGLDSGKNSCEPNRTGLRDTANRTGRDSGAKAANRTGLGLYLLLG